MKEQDIEAYARSGKLEAAPVCMQASFGRSRQASSKLSVLTKWQTIFVQYCLFEVVSEARQRQPNHVWLIECMIREDTNWRWRCTGLHTRHVLQTTPTLRPLQKYPKCFSIRGKQLTLDSDLQEAAQNTKRCFCSKTHIAHRSSCCAPARGTTKCQCRKLRVSEVTEAFGKRLATSCETHWPLKVLTFDLTTGISTRYTRFWKWGKRLHRPERLAGNLANFRSRKPATSCV